MERVNKILNHPTYKTLLEELSRLEKDRFFCKHSLEHFLDVARIAYINVLERGLSYKKEIIYAIALLHDIGRVEEYKNGISHDIASVKIAEEILIEINEEDLNLYKDLYSNIANCYMKLNEPNKALEYILKINDICCIDKEINVCYYEIVGTAAP